MYVLFPESVNRWRDRQSGRQIHDRVSRRDLERTILRVIENLDRLRFDGRGRRGDGVNE